MAGHIAAPARYNPAAAPQPYGRGLEGPRGPVFGAVSQDNPPPMPLLQDELEAASLTYARPYYDNGYGAAHSSGVTTYDPEASAIRPIPARSVPVPTSRKRYDVGTIRRMFGAWAQSFPNGGRGVPRPRVQTATDLARALQARRPQMQSPYYPRLTESPAVGPSYGALTEVLPVTPMTESLYG